MPAPSFLATAHAAPMPPLSLRAFEVTVMMLLLFLALPWDAGDACPLFPIHSPYNALQLTCPMLPVALHVSEMLTIMMSFNGQ